MFGELVRDSKRYRETRANENLESMVTRQNFLLLTLFLRLTPNETYCVNTNRNSQNCLNNRN